MVCIETGEELLSARSVEPRLNEVSHVDTGSDDNKPRREIDEYSSSSVQRYRDQSTPVERWLLDTSGRDCATSHYNACSVC